MLSLLTCLSLNPQTHSLLQHPHLSFTSHQQQQLSKPKPKPTTLNKPSHNLPRSALYFHNPETEAFDANEGDLENKGLELDSGSLALLLKSCCEVGDVEKVHALAVKCFGWLDLFVYNNLVSGYLRVGGLSEARRVFDEMPERNVVTLTTMIDGYFGFGFDEVGLRLFRDCVDGGVVANSKTFVSVLNACGRRVDLELGRQVHACVVKGNWRNLIVDSAVVYFYARCGEWTSAFCVFDRMAERDVVCWTSLITACSQQGLGEMVFGLFSRMLSEGFLANEFTVCSVLKGCREEKALRFGRQLHSCVVKKVYKDDVFVGSSLVDMYANCGEVSDSWKVFDGMRIRNTVTWTSIIAGYARDGQCVEAINLFRVMMSRKVISNNLTVVCILRACGSISALLLGKEIHARMIKSGFPLNEYLGSTLIWFYCKCGNSHTASKIFQELPFRDVVSWTAIISGYACLGYESEALEFLKEMMDKGVDPNPFTYSSALKACADLESIQQGKLIHSFANKTLASSNVFVGSALIHMYSKCGYVSEAIQIFESMPERNLVAWRTMILGYAKNGFCNEALKLLYRMKAEGFKVDDYVFATVMGACGDTNCDLDLDLDPSSEKYVESTVSG